MNKVTEQSIITEEEKRAHTVDEEISTTNCAAWSRRHKKSDAGSLDELLNSSRLHIVDLADSEH